MVGVEKSHSQYLDGSISLRRNEKSEQLFEAITKLPTPQTILEIGPGGGAALLGLAERVNISESEAHILNGSAVHCLEMFPTCSDGLSEAELKLKQLGASVAHIVGDAIDIPAKNGSYDIVNCSSVFHEIYSYAGGTDAVKKALNEIHRVIKPGGYLLFRDVYPVDVSLHAPIVQEYKHDSWVNFVQFFLQYYLQEAPHSYKTPVSMLYGDGKARTEVPAGLAREIQRHYITFRDHILRSELMQTKIDTDRFEDTEWHRTELGFEKKIYLAEIEDPIDPQLPVYLDRTGTFATASEFDTYVDTKLKDFFERWHDGDQTVAEVFNQWLTREGKEAYIYASSAVLVDMIRTAGKNDDVERFSITRAADYYSASRDYYTTYLERALGSSALPDKKLITTFQRI